MYSWSTTGFTAPDIRLYEKNHSSSQSPHVAPQTHAPVPSQCQVSASCVPSSLYSWQSHSFCQEFAQFQNISNILEMVGYCFQKTMLQNSEGDRQRTCGWALQSINKQILPWWMEPVETLLSQEVTNFASAQESLFEYLSTQVRALSRNSHGFGGVCACILPNLKDSTLFSSRQDRNERFWGTVVTVNTIILEILSMHFQSFSSHKLALEIHMHCKTQKNVVKQHFYRIAKGREPSEVVSFLLCGNSRDFPQTSKHKQRLHFLPQMQIFLPQ